MERGDKIKNISEQDMVSQSLIAWENFGYEKINDINFKKNIHAIVKLKKDNGVFYCKLEESILKSNKNKFNEEKLINNILIEELKNNKIENENIVIPKAVELIQSNGVDGIIYEYFNDSSEKYDYSDEEKISILLRVDKFIKSIPLSERFKFLLQKRTIVEYLEKLNEFMFTGSSEIKSMAVELSGLLRADNFESSDMVLNHGDLDMSNIGYDLMAQKIAIFDLEALCIGNSINALAHCSYQSVLYKIYNRLPDKDKQQVKRWDVIAGADFYKIIESKITETKSLKQFYGINMFYALSECFDGLSIKNNNKILEIELEENIKFFHDNIDKLNKITQ